MTLEAELLATVAVSDIPIKTPDLIAIHATGLSNPRARVWSALLRLERLGLVRRSGKGSNCTLWGKPLTKGQP